MLGPDHPDTLVAATALTFALAGLGEAGSARTLAHDTVQHGRQVLGPDHPATLVLAQVASGGDPAADLP